MYVLWIMFVFIVLCIVIIIRGPSLWDRFLGVNIINTKIIVIIIIYASYHKMAYLLDFAIVYVLLAFISTFFTARFLLRRTKEGGE